MPRWWVGVALVLCTLTTVHGASACSQCMCGTPFPAEVLGGVVPAQFTYGLEERYLSKSNALDDGPGQEREREHRVAAFGMWRPLGAVALLGRVPYNVKQITSRPAGGAPDIETSRGIGDAELLVLAGIYRSSGSAPRVLGLVIGGTVPTGSNDVRAATGTRLDSHLQPGSGAWSVTAGVNFAVTGGRGVWDASALGRTSGTSSHGYRYGDVVLYNAGFTSHAWRGLQWLAQLNGRAARRDRLENGTIGVNTGGSVTYASPGVRWRSGFGLTAEAALQVPVTQSLFGDQTERTTGRLTLSMTR